MPDTTLVTAADSLRFSDAASVRVAIVIGEKLSESLGDALPVSYSLAHPDRQAGTDQGYAMSLGYQTGIATCIDTLSFSEYAGFPVTLRAKADTITFSDVAAALDGIQSEVGFSDSASAHVLVIARDTLSFSEAVSGGMLRRAVDALSFTDSASAPFRLTRLTDALLFTDTAGLNVEKSPDTASFSDTASASAMIIATDAIRLSDAAYALRIIRAADTLSLADRTAIPLHGVVDTLKFMEALTLPNGVLAHIVNVPDVGFSDRASVQVAVSETDGVTFSDIARAYAKARATEALSFSDVWTVTKVSAPYSSEWS
jgi:hypothetical protein